MSFKDFELDEISLNELDDVVGGAGTNKTNKIKCDKCDMVFTSKVSLERHKLLVHTKNRANGGSMPIA